MEEQRRARFAMFFSYRGEILKEMAFDLDLYRPVTFGNVEKEMKGSL